MRDNIFSLSQARSDKTLERATALMQSLCEDDLHTLQHDVRSRPSGTLIPASLKECFFEWLHDSYGPFESEALMAPERQARTETLFLEEAAHGDDPPMAAMALHILQGAVLSVVPLATDAPG